MYAELRAHKWTKRGDLKPAIARVRYKLAQHKQANLIAFISTCHLRVLCNLALFGHKFVGQNTFA